MNFNGWTIIEKLGEGGQGEVSLVLSPDRSSERPWALHAILAGLETASASTSSSKDRYEGAAGLADALGTYLRPNAVSDLGALKRYKIPAGSEGEQARQRFAREVEALKAISHPNLLQLIEADVSANWMITRYYDGRTLGEQSTLFRDRPVEALSAFRGLVAGVAALHDAGAIHRDIKPTNIFVSDGELVLGDFGIVFLEGTDNARLTETFERVGTRDWMPPWANTGTRIDEVRPSFDVFCLGKTLWAMLSGRPMLQLWYFKKPIFDLAHLFPQTAAMQVINDRILAACVVENQEDCLVNATHLLARVDDVLDTIKRERQAVGDDMRCLLCSTGKYQLLHASRSMNSTQTSLRKLSLPPDPHENHELQQHEMVYDKNLLTVRAYRCTQCGHLAFFQFPDGRPLSAWNGLV